jgi:menaquinone-dependent protoporphyrinogen oxidase
MLRRNGELRVLVAVASKHGSTEGVARTIAEQLRKADLDVDLREVSELTGLNGYDAVVFGSAVYMGKLLPEARAFIQAQQAQLRNVPVWLFTSGPISQDAPLAKDEAPEVGALAEMICARDHKIFAGKLDKRELGVQERIVAKIVGAKEGDFRDWKAIEAWAREIAHALTAAKVS